MSYNAAPLKLEIFRMTIGNATTAAVCIIAICAIIGALGGTVDNPHLDLEGGRWGFTVGIVLAIIWIVGVVVCNSRAQARRHQQPRTD